MTCVGAKISSKELQARKNLHEKLCDYIDEFIWRLHFSKYVLNVVSFQLISSREICKHYPLTSNQ